MFLSETEDLFLESSESLQSCVAKDLFHESFEAFRRMNNIDPICIRSNFYLYQGSCPRACSNKCLRKTNLR